MASLDLVTHLPGLKTQVLELSIQLINTSSLEHKTGLLCIEINNMS